MNDFIIWSPGVTLDQIERQVIEKAFAFFRKNKTQTAQALGIAIRTLENKFERYEKEDAAALEAQAQREQAAADFQRRCRGEAPVTALKDLPDSVPVGVGADFKPPKKAEIDQPPAPTPKAASGGRR